VTSLPEQVLSDARDVVARAGYVRLKDEAAARWAERAEMADPADAPSPWDGLTASRDETANLVLLSDALNFCFWSPRPLHTRWLGRPVERHTAFTVLLADAVRRERAWLDPDFWSGMTREIFAAPFAGAGELLMIEERVAVVQETGRILRERYAGRFARLAEDCDADAARVAQRLFEEFPSFTDRATHQEREVRFAKRAQICAIDLSIAWRRAGHAGLEGLDSLTAFADYRIPQILRHLGVIDVAPELAQRIERQEPLAPGGPEEVELRAATVQGVERMRRACAARGAPMAAWRIDFELWRLTHEQPMCCDHHRTRTIYY